MDRNHHRNATDDILNTLAVTKVRTLLEVGSREELDLYHVAVYFTEDKTDRLKIRDFLFHLLASAPEWSKQWGRPPHYPRIIPLMNHVRWHGEHGVWESTADRSDDEELDDWLMKYGGFHPTVGAREFSERIAKAWSDANRVAEARARRD